MIYPSNTDETIMTLLVCVNDSSSNIWAKRSSATGF